MTVILFTGRAPHPLTVELSHHRHQLFEAVAISEVYAPVDQHPMPQIITADVDPERARAIQHHYPTLHLKPENTVANVLFELSHFTKGTTVQ